MTIRKPRGRAYPQGSRHDSDTNWGSFLRESLKKMKIFDIAKDKLPEGCPKCHNENLHEDKITTVLDTEYRAYTCLKCDWTEIYDMGPSLFGAISGHFPDNKNCFETIRETTVGSLGDVSVGMANMCEQEYILEGKWKVSGLTCLLVPLEHEGNEKFVVGRRSVVSIGGSRWMVADIHKTSGKLGYVTLRRLKENQSPYDAIEPEELDFYFHTECPACGRSAGWGGSIDTGEEGQRLLQMFCTHCSNVFSYYNGSAQEELHLNAPCFTPGRK